MAFNRKGQQETLSASHAGGWWLVAGGLTCLAGGAYGI